MKKHNLTFLLLASLCVSAFADFNVALDYSGSLAIHLDGAKVATVTPSYFLPGWASRGYAGDFKDYTGDEPIEAIGGRNDDEHRVKMHMSYKLVGSNALTLNYVFTPLQDMKAHSIHASLSFPSAQVAGRPIYSDGKQVAVTPEVLQEKIHVFAGPTNQFAVDSQAGRITIDFPKKLPVLWQDSRQWGDSIGLRIGANSETPESWEGGVPYEVSFTITFPQNIVFDREKPIFITAGDEWIPLKSLLEIQPGSALDFTDVVKIHAPAGKFGWTKAVGQNFEFEGMPGVSQRFYGVNFCFSAHNITPEQSEILAERLARLGYNAVRYHHYERNICITNKIGDSTQLNPEKMVMFDAMFNAMKKRGLYATTDLYVSRDVYATEIWPDQPDPKEKIKGQNFKRLCMLLPSAMENWKKFARNFMTHRNPHTGLTYAEDPSLNLISLINEGTIDVFGNPAYNEDPRFRKAYFDKLNAWLKTQYKSTEERNNAWDTPDLPEILDKFPEKPGPEWSRDLTKFYYDLESAMFREMNAFLKDELKCKALITNLNCGGIRAWSMKARADHEYLDNHFYVDHPSFIKNPWSLPSRCSNESVVKRGLPGGNSLSFSRYLDKPFTVTEFNYSGPGRYRSVGGILTGCLAAIQNWNGMWRFAYSHGSQMFSHRAATYFDLVGDPLNQAAERAVICLYLRGDLPEAKHSIAVSIPENQLEDKRNEPNPSAVPGWQKCSLLAKVGIYHGKSDSKVPADLSIPLGYDAPKAKNAIPYDDKTMSADQLPFLLDFMKKNNWIDQDNQTTVENEIVQSADGRFTIRANDDIMLLNTPKTAGAYAPKDQTVKTDAVTVTMLDTEATVWVSSLTDQPIPSSKRLLVTHLTDLRNTGDKFAEKARKTILRWGGAPHLVRYGRAVVTIKLDDPQKATVYAIDLSGKRLNTIPAKASKDGLEINLDVKGTDGAQMLYEITVD